MSTDTTLVIVQLAARPTEWPFTFCSCPAGGHQGVYDQPEDTRTRETPEVCCEGDESLATGSCCLLVWRVS